MFFAVGYEAENKSLTHKECRQSFNCGTQTRCYENVESRFLGRGCQGVGMGDVCGGGGGTSFSVILVRTSLFVCLLLFLVVVFFFLYIYIYLISCSSGAWISSRSQQ